MSRVFSFRDLRRVPSLSKFTEVQLLSIEKDDEINAVLASVGFDTSKPILYVPSKHRDLSGHVEVGFRAIGEMNDDPIYRNSRLCPLVEHLIWASQKDPSLARELSRMIGHSVNLEDEAIEDDSHLLIDEDIEPDYEIVRTQIETLTALRDSIRGSAYNEQGNLKTPGEYKA